MTLKVHNFDDSKKRSEVDKKSTLNATKLTMKQIAKGKTVSNVFKVI